MVLPSKIKFYKTMKYLEKNKFSVNCGNILSDKIKMMPLLKWVFLQSKDCPHIFQVDLAIAYKKNYDKVSSVYTDVYLSLSEPEFYIISDSEELESHFYYDIIGQNHNVVIVDFHQNAFPNDIYTLDDLKKIIKYVSNEITESLYLKGDNNNINVYDEEVTNKPFSKEKVKQLIKNGHRNYMNETRE